MANRGHNKFKNRKIDLGAWLTDAMRRLFPTAEKVAGKQIRNAIKKLAELVTSDTYDLVISGLGTIESTSLAGKEKYVRSAKLTTLYPPGAVKLKFKSCSRIKARGRCSIFEKGDGKTFTVKKQYNHLYDAFGVPYEWIPASFLFDSGEVARRRFPLTSIRKIDEENEAKNG